MSPRSTPGTSPSATMAEPASYEAALAELEQLVGRIESGQMPLDELLGAYRRGADLLQYCRGRLDAVEQQVRMLDETGIKPWTPE